jgi:VIT1/CCC1 family predicted Fe2+/Mn2+ transporter
MNSTDHGHVIRQGLSGRSHSNGDYVTYVLVAKVGVVSTAILVAGMGAANTKGIEVSVVGLVASALSMAAGEYASVASRAGRNKQTQSMNSYNLQRYSKSNVPTIRASLAHKF